jgi:hypothetical protein
MDGKDPSREHKRTMKIFLVIDTYMGGQWTTMYKFFTESSAIEHFDELYDKQRYHEKSNNLLQLGYIDMNDVLWNHVWNHDNNRVFYEKVAKDSCGYVSTIVFPEKNIVILKTAGDLSTDSDTSEEPEGTENDT